MSEEGSVTEHSSEFLENNSDETALAAIEETLKLPTLPELAPKNMPTLQTVFGRGGLATLKSFGGKSLAENMERVDGAIAKTRELSNVYNRNHTEWTRRMINMEYYDPWMNMRQISAEMTSRRQALDDAKYRQLENEVELRKLTRKLERKQARLAEYQARGGGEDTDVILNDEELDEMDDLDLEIMGIQIEISKMQEGMLNGMSYIEGAMKEVLILEDLYDQLLKKIEEENEDQGFSEVEWEHNNARAHLRMAVSQSLRDVRQGGSISKGEQRLLEQIGINPGVLQRELRDFVRKFEEGIQVDEDGKEIQVSIADQDMSVNTLRNFIEHTAERLIPFANLKSEMFGFRSETRTDYMYTDKIALQEKPDSEE